MVSKTAVCCGVLAAAWLQAAAAQQQPRPHPADPAATTPALVYTSAFAEYQPLRDEKPVSWRDANDEVARAGGHIGIFRHLIPGATPAPSSPAKPAQTHGGHR